MDIPYVNSYQKFKQFITRLPTVGVPPKVNYKFLESLGYKSSNDRQFIRVLKFIGLVDSNTGIPTDLWKKMRADLAGAIAIGVSNGYENLFQLYPNAHDIDVEALNAYFKTNTELNEGSVKSVVSTFKALVELGEFSPSQHEESIEHTQNNVRKEEKSSVIPNVSVSDPVKPLVVNVNIQLQVPPDSTGEVYEKFFDAMNKYLIQSHQ